MARTARKDTHDLTPRNLGRYRLYGELAAGGMATVHLGRQIGSGGFSKMVAIKRLHPQFGKVEEFVEMFLAEARLAARIRHPNVVQPLDVLRVEDEVFLVMEYVEGDSLSRLMKATVSRQEKVSLPIAVAIMSGVLRGLHAAHEAKSDKGEPLAIVHRDVSPQNVLVGVDGTPRVIDFGIAKAADSVQLTREGELKGKLAYIAPEILSGQRGTRRADIYAAAVVLWEVLTAQRLFDADYQSAVIANILHRAVDPPSDLVPGLPPALDAVVMKGLARDPSDRYATGREMAIALEEAIPAASPAVVGEWVEAIASVSLQSRGNRVAQIEASSSEEDAGPEPEEVLSEFMTVSTEPLGGPEAMPRVSSTLLGVGVGRAPPPPSTNVGPAAIPVAPPPPPPRAPTPPPPAPISARSLAGGPTSGVPATLAGPGPTINVGPAEQVAPEWPVPGIAAAPPGTKVTIVDDQRSSGGGIVVLICVLALTCLVLYLGLPEFLKRSYPAMAAGEGVTMTVDSVEVTWRRARLVGVTMTMADLPGFSLNAKSVEILFSTHLDPTDAMVHEATLTIDGTGTAVEDTIRRMRLAHEFAGLRNGTVRELGVDAGHLVWARALGEGTRLEAENIALNAEREGKHPLGDDLTFASPLVSLTAPWGRVGSWAVKGQVEGAKTKGTFTFDPSGASKATATFALDGGSLSAFDLMIPRANISLLGVSNALLGRRPDEALYVEGEGHLLTKSPSQIESSLRLNLSGVRLTNALATTDSQFEAHADGDPAKPIDVTRGAFNFGPFHGVVTGPVTFGTGFFRADLALRTGTAHCPGGPDAMLGGSLLIDTRTLGDARIGVAPTTHCGLKLLPP